MGDIIETTVAAYQPFFYYKVSGNGLWFELKAQNSGLIGLGETYGRTRVWFEFSNGVGSGVIKIIENNETKLTKAGLPFTLSADNYTRFWIAWNGTLVWAGLGNSSDVAISFPMLLKVDYVTFATIDSPYQSHFRFEIPPLCLREPKVPNEPKITKGKLVWKRCHDQLPDEAVIGGHINGEIVYIVRAHHRLSLTPGVFIPSRGLAYIPWGESDNPTGNFEALCGYNLEWKAGSDDKIPVDALVSGYSEVNSEPIYIGRVWYMGNKIPGKVQLSHKVCYIAHEGKVMAFKDYEVLTMPGLNAGCGNTHVVTADTVQMAYDLRFVALCGVNLEWKAATSLTMPVDAFVAGFSEDNHESLYIGRASYEGNKIPGKVQLSHNTCYIAHKGKEIAVKNFDVLVVPGLNAYCANKYLKFVGRQALLLGYNRRGPEDSDEED